MGRAWFMDNSMEDQRLEHHLNPQKFISMDYLYSISGVEYFNGINLKTGENVKLLEQLIEDRNYSYEDELTCSKDCLPDYEEKIKSFFQEHLHTDDEIRLVLEGSGYFDIRDINDKWIRIEVIPGDLLVIPSGIYHRFTLDTNNFIKAKRFFIGEPIWTPHNRPAEYMPCREKYLAQMSRITTTDS